MFVKFSFIWSVMITLFINTINTKNIKFSKQTKKELSDDYYAIFVNNTSTSSSFINKREESQKEFINSLVNEIHELIVENVDSYENTNKIEKMIENEKLRKRENDQNESNIVFHLSSIDNRTVIGAFLSGNLIDKVKDIDGVYDVTPNRHFEYAAHYNKNDIIKETKWKDVAIRSKADGHLSMISQGKFNENLVEKYDNNYYYPKSGGEDIDIFIFDNSFAFEHEEFTNNQNRITKCVVILSSSETNPPQTEKKCHSMFSKEHGSIVADVAAGAVHGVAPNANVYGFVLEDSEPTFFAVTKGLEMLNNGSLFRKNKAVINFSFGAYFSENEYTSDIEYLHDLIQQLNNKGAVFVSCAQNYGKPINNKDENEILYPCYYDNVICVGATENSSYDDYYMNKILSDHPYQLASYSNYGEGINIYAPGFVNYSILTQYYGEKTDFITGTSFASPIVTGMIATIMSDNQNKKYNYKNMLKILQEISLRNVVEGVEKNHSSNYFVNNGKHVVYSENSKYHGCGINAGNQKCSRNKCCTADGYCSSNKNLC